MNKPIYFEHQIVQPDDMTFLVDSTTGAIDQNLALFTNQEPGLVAGLALGGTVGINKFTVTQGYGYDSTGERLEIFPSTGVAFPISFTGTQPIYARLGAPINYNPDPAENPLGAFGVVQSVNPDTGDLVDVQSFNNVLVDTLGISGTDIFLGLVTADSAGKFVSKDTSGADHLKFIGAFDLNTQTIDGNIIATGTIDSTRFTNPLTAAINLGTAANIVFVGSGTNSIGSTAAPLANIYSTEATFHQIHGNSPILVDTLNLVTGSSLESQSGRVMIDTGAKGTQFGTTIYSTGLSAPGLNSIKIYTPSGNITLASATGTVNLSNATNIGSSGSPQDLTVYGQLVAKTGIDISGSLDLTNADLTISQSNFNSKNLLSNSDFSMGIPTHYTGLEYTLYKATGAQANVNFTGGVIAVFSPYEERYQNQLSPYNWVSSGNSAHSFICGTAQEAPETIGLNEIQQLSFTEGVLAATPSTGVMTLSFTGPNQPTFLGTGSTYSGTFSFYPSPPSIATLQSGLEAFNNIYPNNIVVSSGLNGTGLSYTFEFQNSLGFSGVNAISPIRISTSGGSWDPSITTIQQGYSPVSSGSVIKDPTALDVGQATYARFSGATTSQASPMVIYAPINSFERSDFYNLSFYTKTTSNEAGLEYVAGIEPATTGLAYNLLPTTAHTQQNWNGWTRRTAIVNSNNDFSEGAFATIGIRPTGAGSITGVLANIAGVQLTKGPNLFGYANNQPTIFKMIEPSGVSLTQGFIVNPGATIPTTAPGGGVALTFNTAPANGLKRWTFNRSQYESFWWTNAPWNFQANLPIVTGSFYCPGAMVEASADMTSLIYGLDRYQSQIIIDGKVVTSRHYGTTPQTWRQEEIRWGGYLPRGEHSIMWMFSPTLFQPNDLHRFHLQVGHLSIAANPPFTAGPGENPYAPEGYYPTMPQLIVTMFN